MKQIIFLMLIFFNINVFSQILEPPVLLLPENNAEIDSSNVLFTWAEVENATYYQIIIYQTEPNSYIFADEILNQNSFSISIIVPVPFCCHGRIDEYYTWKVKAFNETDSSQWSEIRNLNMYEPPFLESLSDNSSLVLIDGAANNITINNRQIQIGDIIGVFYQKTPGEWKIGGYSAWNGSSAGLTVWGDDTRTPEKDGFSVGETITYRIWDSQLNKEWNANATYFSGPSAYEINGISILLSLNTIPDELNIPLQFGWNIISSNLIPDEPAMTSIFEGMNNYFLVKNDAGQIYSPFWGLEQIGDWNIEAGYYVYTNSSSILNISGNEVNPVLQGIQLNPGWNLVSYLRNSPMNAQQALAGISSQLIMAKNNLGGIYHPGFGINTLGEMQPGQGYWLYLSSPVVLTYPGN